MYKHTCSCCKTVVEIHQVSDMLFRNCHVCFLENDPMGPDSDNRSMIEEYRLAWLAAGKPYGTTRAEWEDPSS